MSARPPRIVNDSSSSSRSSITTTRLKYQSGAWTAPPAGADSVRTLAILFGPQNALDAATSLGRQLPASHVIGCATERAFGAAANETFAQLVTFEKTELVTAFAEVAPGAQAAAGSIAEQLARPGLRAILLFVDGSGVDPDALVKALRAACPSSVVIAGGVVGKGAWLVADKTARPGLAVAVGLYGDHVAVGQAARSGFEAFGPERQVTRATDRVVHEIDNRPALQFLMEQIGAASPDAVLRMPMIVGSGAKGPRNVVIPIAVDASALSVTFGRSIPAGSTVRLMRADNEKLLDEVANAAGLAKAQNATTEGPVLLFLASSMVRQRTLGDRVEDQIDAALDVLPKQLVAHTVGLSSLGEIGSMGTGADASDVNSGIVSVFVLSESRASLAEHANPAETPSPAVVARTSRPAKAQVVRPLLSASGLVSAAAKVTKSRQGDITIVAVSGRLTESFKGEQLGRELAGTVVFDLSKIERVTSFGVREWLQMLAASQERVKKLYLSHCSEAVVNQLSMIRKFGGGAQVLSFFAPYLCDSCGEQFERLFDVEADADALKTRNASDVMCPQCGGRAHFDDDPETYFAFIPANLNQSVPLPVRAIHDGIEVAGPMKAADAIDKAIEGNVTRIRATGRAGAVRWQRVFDGSEGPLVVDLGGLSGMDETSIQSLEQALVQLPAEVDSLRLERCPQVLVETFVVGGVPRKVSIASVTLVGHCTSCNTQRPALVVVDEHLANLTPGRAPAIHCRRCNGILDLLDPQDTLTVLAKHRKRTSLAPRGESARPPPVAPVVAAAVDPPPPARMSVPPELVYQQAAPQRSTGIIFASAALVSVALLGSAGAVIFSRRTAPPPPPVAAAATPSAAWAPVADLPPAWVDRAFVIDGDNVYVVGRAARAKTPETALDAARGEAVVQLLKQLHLDLAGNQVHEVSAARMKPPADYGPQVPRIVDRFLHHTQNGPQLERGETVVRQRDGGIEAYARYRLSRATYASLLTSYKRTVSLHGVTVGRLFPLASLEATEADAIVISANPRLLDGSPPRAGDLVRSVGGKPFVFTDTIPDEWFGVPWGAFLSLEFERDGSPIASRIRHGGAVGPVAYAPRPPPPPAPAAPPPAATPPAGGPAPLATSYRDAPSALAKETPASAKNPDPLGLPALNYRDPPASGPKTTNPPSKKEP